MKLRHGILIANLCIAAFAAHAEDSPAERYGAEYQTCRDGSTYDIVTCLSGLYKKWDARLNAAYQKLLGMQESPKQKAALIEAQKAWIKYRDQNCEWYETGEGTIRRLWGSECMRSMTAARALELEEAGETH